MIYRSIYRLKPFKDRSLFPLAKWFMKHQVTANQVTMCGLFLGIFAAIFIMEKLYIWGILAIILSVFADLLDGTLARLSQKTAPSGKFFDAISDRVVEIAWVGALVFNSKIPWWSSLLPFGSIMLLITRSLAYRQGLETSFVSVTRFERVVAIIGSLLIPWPLVVNLLFIMVIIGTFTSGISIFIVIWLQKQLKVQLLESLKVTPLNEP